MSCILIIDDENDLSELLQYNLGREGFEVLSAASGEEGLRLAREYRPPMVLLDVMLPDLPGTEVCRQLKADPATSGTGVVLLTSRAEEQDRVAGFEAGADDYVTKPFSIRELNLRLKAHLRRREPQTAPPLVLGLLQFDHHQQRCLVGDQELDLTAMEYRLLRKLLTEAGRVVTREELMKDVWRARRDSGSRSLDTYVVRLREKLGPARGCLQTVWGVGYRLALPQSEDGTLPPEAPLPVSKERAHRA